MLMSIDRLLDESFWISVFLSARWRDGIRCVRYHSIMVKKHGKYGKFQRYKCKACNKTWNDKTGTILAYSRLSISEFVMLVLFAFIVHTSILRTAIILGRSTCAYL